MTVAVIAGSKASSAMMPMIVSRTNSTAAKGVLYAAANPAAVPAATSTRASLSDTPKTRDAVAPSDPPNSMSGPSRPNDMPVAIALQDPATRQAVTLRDNLTLPSATASITLLTP
jgi:hypothetical protein